MEPVPGLEAQNISHRDTIQVSADLPDRQNFAVNELVDRFAIELPPLRELGHGEPHRLRLHPV